jgi:peptidoglycan/xylan/chitin deacetylase (PgdA/CDA1 family)
MRELSILCYHGLVIKTPEGFNSSGKHLDLEKFKSQIEFLASKFEIVTMQDVEDFYQKKRDLPKKSVAITFDDGYLNNLYYAHPVLEHLGVKATIYVATGYIGNQRLMWTDKLEQLILSLPHDHLNLFLDKSTDIDISTMSNKLVALNKIKLYLKKSSPEKIDSTIKRLSYLTDGKDLITDPDLHFFLGWNDIKFMNSSGV